MARSMKDIFPPPQEALELEPEELAVLLLKYLSEAEQAGDSNILHLYNLTLPGHLRPYAGEQYEEVAKAITEAWRWLEIEGMIAPLPGQTGRFVFITRKGKKLVSELDLRTYLHGNLIPKQTLDPVLARKVRPLFVRGDYDTAVFQAFKEVEIRVREAANLPSHLIGVPLMRKAFRSQNGPLTDKQQIPAEQQAASDLFAGAIGLFKNPSSHRDVDFEDPVETAELIYFVNLLVRMVDDRSKKVP